MELIEPYDPTRTCTRTCIPTATATATASAPPPQDSPAHAYLVHVWPCTEEDEIAHSATELGRKGRGVRTGESSRGAAGVTEGTCWSQEMQVNGAGQPAGHAVNPVQFLFPPPAGC